MRRGPFVYWFWGVLTAVIVGLLGGAIMVQSGSYDVAATNKDPKIVDVILGHASDRSAESHSRDVQVPGDLGADSMSLLVGAAHYEGNCAQCHGSPAHDRGDVGQGLNPEPPHIKDAAQDPGNKQTFWVAKHGIKMTGMPAFGPTHDDSTLWDIVAFMDHFPHMTAGQYEAWVAAAKAAGIRGDGDEGDR
ncbi:MAG: cytochrome c [Gemmatimonadota bacterium]|jgi:mono/diheme cytochrome c family protein